MKCARSTGDAFLLNKLGLGEPEFQIGRGQATCFAMSLLGGKADIAMAAEARCRKL